MSPNDRVSLCRSITATANAREALSQPIFEAYLGNVDIGELFLSYVPRAYRQEMSCSCCIDFMRSYGHLAIVDTRSGDLRPLFWNARALDSRNVFAKAVAAVADLFRGQQVSREFKITSSQDIQLGTYSQSHMQYRFDPMRIDRGFAPPTKELAEMLDYILQLYSRDTVSRVADLVGKHEMRGSRHVPAITWLRKLKVDLRIDSVHDAVRRHNLLYHHVSGAFVSHVDDVEELSNGTVSRALEAAEAGNSRSEIKQIFEGAVEEEWQPGLRRRAAEQQRQAAQHMSGFYGEGGDYVRGDDARPYRPYTSQSTSRQSTSRQRTSRREAIRRHVKEDCIVQ